MSTKESRALRAKKEREKRASNPEYRQRQIRANQAWAKRNSIYLNKYKVERHKQLRLLALSMYSPAGEPECCCCGESETRFLTIDHIDNKGGEHRRLIGRAGIYGWLFQECYPSGFQTLCFNCNCGRAYNGGVCPHDVVTPLFDAPIEVDLVGWPWN